MMVRKAEKKLDVVCLLRMGRFLALHLRAERIRSIVAWDLRSTLPTPGGRVG